MFIGHLWNDNLWSIATLVKYYSQYQKYVPFHYNLAWLPFKLGVLGSSTKPCVGIQCLKAIWSYHSIVNISTIFVVEFSISNPKCFSPNPWLVVTSFNLYFFISLNFLCLSFCEAFLRASISFCEVILWAFAYNHSWVLFLSFYFSYWPSRNIFKP